MSAMKPILTILVVATLVLIALTALSPSEVAWGAPAATVTIEPFQDTYVDEASPNSSYGSSSELWVSADEFLQQRRSLLQFLLTTVPAGATITGAELQLYLEYSYGVSNIVLTVERNGESWAAGNTRWNDRPATHCCWGTKSVGSTTGVYYTWDVTGLVEDWYEGTLPNYGLTLKGPAQAYDRQFDSREGTYKPKLVVTYTMGGDPTPVPPEGAINGTVWHDNDQNGFIGTGEARLSGVRLDLALDGVVQDTITTNSSGAYGFVGLEDGAYTVSVDDWTLPGAYQLATGSDPRIVTVLADATVNDVDFGYDLSDTDLIAMGLEVTQSVHLFAFTPGPAMACSRPSPACWSNEMGSLLSCCRSIRI